MSETRRWVVAGAGACALLAVGCGDDDRRPPPADGGALDGNLIDGGAVDAYEGPDAGYVPVTLYTSVDLPDAELAAAAFTILAGEDTPACTTCHGLTEARVRQWGATTNDAIDCVAMKDPNWVDDVDDILDCFAADPADRRVPDIHELGLLTTAVHLPWFTRALEIEYLEEPMSSGPDEFRYATQMPMPPVALLTQDDVDILLTWVRRGLPLLTDQITGGGTRCVPMIGPEVAAHITAMQTEGWDVLNRDRGVAMFGCRAGETGSACLSTFPASTTLSYADGWVVEGTLRVLYETNYSSSYWTRSSADGRYVAHGGGAGAPSTIIDLQRRFAIPTRALYDPGFYPNNRGFVFQAVGGGRDGGFCRQSLLDAEPSQVTFGEAECSVFGAVGLYQHVGVVDGGDIWTVFGQFVSDNGGHDVTGPLGVSFDSRSTTSFVPIIDEGDAYRPRAAIRVSTPNEGDAVLAGSSRLTLSRLHGPADEQSGFVLRQIIATPDGGSSYTVNAPVIGRYCQRGAKVGFSFDERYVVFHRYMADTDAAEYGYTGPDDPGFAGYRSQGAANIFLMDLTNGDVRRITTMNPGQYALFPHFRSDGWIYFIVRDPTLSTSVEYVVASDAALVTP